MTKLSLHTIKKGGGVLTNLQQYLPDIFEVYISLLKESLDQTVFAVTDPEPQSFNKEKEESLNLIKIAAINL